MLLLSSALTKTLAMSLMGTMAVTSKTNGHSNGASPIMMPPSQQQPLSQQHLPPHYDQKHSQSAWSRRSTRKNTGITLAKTPVEYLGVSTPMAQRGALGLRGLVPPTYRSLSQEVERCMQHLRGKATPLEQYLYLRTIQDVNENLFYAMIMTHVAELMPIIYTPTVGEACEWFSHTYPGTVRGLYISLQDAGSIRQILDNWPSSDVTTIVVTDGERILGLGDLGINGMAIPIGKLALYSACGGLYPSKQMPVLIDVGTNNQEFLEDPYYLGLRQPRERGPAYDALMTEFVEAVQDKFGPNTLIQWEDFGNKHAFRLLQMFQDKACTFNDDIQGTASVALAGLMSATRVSGKPLSQHRFMFYGAGEAGTGIANLIAYAIALEDKIPIEEARKHIYLVDSKGLVTHARREDLAHHKENYAHDVPYTCPDLLSAIQSIEPSVLIGVSTQANAFNETVCRTMAQLNERPVIFALSNPTSKAECTAKQAYEWTDGKALFASGSPFAPVTLPDGRTLTPGQGNNAYIFPGIGLGVMAAGSTRITDHDMYLAAQALANHVSVEQVQETGCLYPPLSELRHVSAHIAAAVAAHAYETGVATNLPQPATTNEEWVEYCADLMYDPLAQEKEQQKMSAMELELQPAAYV